MGMTEQQEAAMRQARDVLQELDGIDTETECVTIDVGDVLAALDAALEQPASGIKQVIELYDKPEQPAQQEPVAVKQMMRWVDSLKTLSDNGTHMKIPSGLSAGTCWELAVELEQFIKSTRPQAREPLSDEQIEQCMKQAYATVRGRNLEHAFARAIEAAHGIGEKK